MKLTLKTKLMGSFLLVLIMMGIVGFLGINMGSTIHTNAEELASRIHKAELAGELDLLMSDYRRYQIQIVNYAKDGNVAKSTEYIGVVNGFKAEGEKELVEFGGMFNSAEGKALFADLETKLEKYLGNQDELTKLAQAQQYDQALTLLNGKVFDDFNTADEAIIKLKAFNKKQAEAAVVDAEDTYYSAFKIMIAVIIAAILIGISLGLFISISITRVVGQIIAMLKDMAESGGDLTKRITITAKDEIGDLANWFNAFLDKLHDIISQVKQSANMVSTAANETSIGNQDLSQRTEEQASSLEEISSTIEEVTSSLQKSSESATSADTNSKKTLEKVRRGENVVKELREAMGAITQGSHEIAEIIAKVNDIAFQTNLLALNAAVEAARAGEQGRGFAVVAAEVRNLAGRTAESAKEIEGLIKDSINKVERGNDLMHQTSNVLSEIVENTQETTDVIVEIASSMREQSAAADDIRIAVEQLNQVTQQNASLVEEIAGSSESVSHEAEELSGLVGQFKLNESAGTKNNRAVSYGQTYQQNRPKAFADGSRSKTMPRQAVIKTPQAASAREVDFNEADFEKF